VELQVYLESLMRNTSSHGQRCMYAKTFELPDGIPLERYPQSRYFFITFDSICFALDFRLKVLLVQYYCIIDGSVSFHFMYISKFMRVVRSIDWNHWNRIPSVVEVLVSLWSFYF
jgi:hypothetical protein